MTNAKYLEVTIHDNDFSNSLMQTCHQLYSIWCDEGWFPTEENFSDLKKVIKHMWYSVHEAEHIIRWGNLWDDSDKFIYIFEPCLKFVDFFDIPDHDNCESVYIPMFKNAEVFIV